MRSRQLPRYAFHHDRRSSRTAPATCASSTTTIGVARLSALHAVAARIWFTDCGVRPTCPITGMAASTMARITVLPRDALPSTFTASAPPSLTKRPGAAHRVFATPPGNS